VRVPAGGLVGEENQGFYYIMDTFALERLAAAATSVGASDVAIAATLRYMGERHAFGKPLSKFQALRHRLADLFAELEAVRALVYHAAWLVQQGESGVREAAMAKLLATELNKKVADECVQFHGGYGYVEEYAVERFYRDARVSTIVAGTSEIMREIIAKTDIDGIRFAKAETRARPVQPEEPAGPIEPASPLPVPPVTPSAPTPAPVTLADFFRSLPTRLRPDKTADWSSRFHFKLKNSAHPEWTVVIDGPRCEVVEGLVGSPSCVVSTSEDVYLGIENGTQNPQTAFLLGKVKISNVAEMMRYVKSFTPVFQR
jgi:putative sterol carrier protein